MNYKIITEKLIKKFKGIRVLDNINIKIPENSISALFGKNGAGKTTLIKCMVNILNIDSGYCEIIGKKNTELNHKDFSKIAYISENQKLPNWMTVEEFLNYCKFFYEKWNVSLCENLLKKMDLCKSRTKFISQLSKGMRIKISLISSIVYDPELIILDEPFNGVDIIVRKEIIESLLEVVTNCESTILISTHDADDIENFIDHINILSSGKLRISDKLENIQNKMRKIEFQTEEYFPKNLPWQWLNAKKSGRLAAFIHSDFKEENIDDEIKNIFSDCTDLRVSFLNLKDILIQKLQ